MSSLVKINLNDNENWIKIRNENNWEVILASKEILYKCLLDLVFDKTNLFYYATQRQTTKTLKMAKNEAEKLAKNGELECAVDSILKNIGFTEDKIVLKNNRFRGDFGELLMANLVDSFTNAETVICKVSLKTSPDMSSYGNDNLFYDYHNKILYFGESKFHETCSKAFSEACKSLDIHEENELNYIYSSTSNFIAKNGRKLKKIVKKLGSIKLKDVTIAKISFIIEENLYLKKDLEDLINSKKDKIDSSNILVFVPILSKKEFINYIKENIDSYGK